MSELLNSHTLLAVGQINPPGIARLDFDCWDVIFASEDYLANPEALVVAVPSRLLHPTKKDTIWRDGERHIRGGRLIVLVDGFPELTVKRITEWPRYWRIELYQEYIEDADLPSLRCY